MENRLCRACGVGIDGVGKYTLEALGVRELPPFCDGLCMACLDSINVPTDDAGEPVRSVSETDVLEFLAGRVRLIAGRVQQGLSVIRCEAVVNTNFGDRRRCSHFGTRTIRGRLVCWPCFKGAAGRRPISFVDEPLARCFVLWARTREELTETAREEWERPDFSRAR